MDKTNETANCDVYRLEMVQNNYEEGYRYGTEGSVYMKTDTACILAIIKTPDIKIRNGIGTILKGHNIFEYGSLYKETDINCVYKTLAYASLYKSCKAKDTDISPEDITLSIISSKYPEDFARQMDGLGMPLSKTGNGIYQAGDRMIFKTQVIVFRELDPEEQEWLEALVQYVQDTSVPKIFLELKTSFI